MLQEVSYSAEDYVGDLLRARYCLHLRGDTTTSRRLFDSVAAGCIPVIISDGVNLPFESQIAWRRFAIFIPEDEVFKGRSPRLRSLIKGGNAESRRNMRHALRLARHHVLYGLGSPFHEHNAVFLQNDTAADTTAAATAGLNAGAGSGGSSPRAQAKNWRGTGGKPDDSDDRDEALLEALASTAANRLGLDGQTGANKPSGKHSKVLRSHLVDHILQQAMELVHVRGKYRRYPPTFHNCGTKEKEKNKPG